MALGSSKHPLFQRLEQRGLIFKQQRPSSLILDSHKLEDLEAFVRSFDEELEAQAMQFHDTSDPKFPRVFADLICKRTVTGTLELLCAFIDRLFDLDFVLTITALLPYQDSIAVACSGILRSHETEALQLPFLMRTIALLFGAIVSETGSAVTDEKATLFLSRAVSLLQTNDVSIANLVLEGVKRFLRAELYRERFVESGATDNILSLLTAAAKLPHSDTLYHLLFCVWELTYSSEGVGRLSAADFVSLLGRLLATIPPEREEIVRLLTAIIGQLNPSTVFVENAYDHDILRLFRMFQAKKYVDPELAKDIAGAAEGLHQQLKHLSLWDKYLREVKSGVLHWSVSHKSEFFWKANLERFGEHHYHTLTLLTGLLASQDQETVCVACRDLGEFAARSAIGRVKLEEIGAKEAVIRLMMSSQSQAIQREALRTTQLLLLRTQGSS